MLPAKLNAKKHLAPKAGFIKFCPRPPNNCFTIIMANAPPSAAFQYGKVHGRFNARIIPVTTALKSYIVIF